VARDEHARAVHECALLDQVDDPDLAHTIGEIRLELQSAIELPRAVTDLDHELHLLREDSVERAVAAFPTAEAIFENNMRTLEKLGLEGWTSLREQWERDAAAEAARQGRKTDD